MSQRAHNLLNCVNVKAPADFYECCKNQRPVLLCTIPMLFHQLSSSQKQNKVMQSDIKCQFQVSKVGFGYQNIQTFPWFQVFWGQEDPKDMFDRAEFKYHFFLVWVLKRLYCFSSLKVWISSFWVPNHITNQLSSSQKQNKVDSLQNILAW